MKSYADRAKSPPARFKLLSATEISNLPQMAWLLRGVLPSVGIAALFGPSGAGKSFIALDLSVSVACGEGEWFGRRVTKCPVTYCALEGQAGLRKRLDAWSKFHSKPLPDGLRFVAQSIDLLNHDDVSGLAEAIRYDGHAGGLVVLDTLNRAMPGADENSSVAMGNIIAAVSRLQESLGGLVLLVHHTGKDASKGLRGHSSLHAALDGAIEVSASDNRRQWRVAKSKDDETGSTYPFKLVVVPVGFTDEGDEITSCVVVADESGKALRETKLPRGENQRTAQSAIDEALAASTDFGRDGAPTDRPCIRLNAVKGLVAQRMSCDAKHRGQRATEAIETLVAGGHFAVHGEWLCKG